MLRVADYLNSRRWQEPILLAAAHLSLQDNYKEADQFVRDILNAKTPYEQQLRGNLFLAARCVADSVRRGPILVQEIVAGIDEAFTTSIVPLNYRIEEAILVMRGNRVAASEGYKLILRKVSHPNDQVRRVAATVLGKMEEEDGGKAASVLLGLLGDPHSHVRRATAAALRALARSAKELAVPATMLSRFGEIEPSFVLQSVALALGELGRLADEKVVTALKNHCTHLDFNVRCAVNASLRNLGQSFGTEIGSNMQYLEEVDTDLDQFAVEGMIGRFGVEQLLDYTRMYDTSARKVAVQTLGRMGQLAARKRVLDRLSEMAYSPAEQGTSVEDAAYEALSRLIPLYRQELKP